MEYDSTIGRRRTGPVRAAALVIAAGLLALPGVAWGQIGTFDDRSELSQGGFAPSPQIPALEALEAELGGRLTYGFNEFTGVTTGLRSVDGRPIGSAEGRDPATIARNFALANVVALGLEEADLSPLTGVAARDTGDVIVAINDVNADSYRVYAQPCESPFVCNRTLVQDPAEGTASPNGWHSSTLMQGNNVNAYHDRDANNLHRDPLLLFLGQGCSFGKE